MIPTSVNGPGSSTQTAATATIGIASLILEGRALSDDDFVTTTASPLSRSEYKSRRLIDDQKFATYLSSRPSVTFNNTSSDLNFELVSSSSASAGNSSDPTLQHMERLRQKLGQLRQSSPSTSRGKPLSAEQTVMVGNSSITSPNENDDDDDENELMQYPKQSTNKYVHPIAATLQSLASTCLRTTTPRTNKVLSNNEPFFNNSGSNGGSDGGYMGVKASSSSYGLENILQKPIKTPPTRSADKAGTPKQGPHCDQFLRKVGLTKADVADVEEHICDMANLNEICYRWQLHCRQIDFIMSTMEPICIEVYLGPESHEILLEQWVIYQNDKSTTPTMTLQSLSNAIRSQLYFSQIIAWADLIKNAKPHDRDIIEHGRIKLVEKCVNGVTVRTPRLDIFYRIRSYDATACFNSKPSVHDFPNVVIAENCSVSVCLKSLPRIQNGIPRINFVEHENINNPNNCSCNNSNNNCSSSHNNHPAAVASSSRSDANDADTSQSDSPSEESMVLDDRLDEPCQEKGKHRCVFDEEDYTSSDAVADGLSSAEVSHRQKQLLKYRRRILKRDKKKLGLASSSKVSNDAVLGTLSKRGSLKSEHMEQKMQIGDCKELPSEDNHSRSSSYQSLNHSNHSQQSIPEFGSINAYQPPLYRTQEATVAEGVQTNSVEMVTIGTQTPNFHFIIPCCENCGNNMELVCTRCDFKKGVEKQISPSYKANCSSGQGRPKTCTNATSDARSHNENKANPQKLGKGDLLLQAIERTPRHKFNSDARNNNNSKSPPKSKSNDCQLCKRQKTQHTYRNGSSTDERKPAAAYAYVAGNSDPGNKSPKMNSTSPSYDGGDQVDRHMSSDCACSDEYAENCCLKSNSNGSHPSYIGNSNRNSSLELKLSDDIDAQFKTPKSGSECRSQCTPKNNIRPTPLHINCSEKFSVSKLIPKINLTNIFSDGPSTSCSSAPIPIASAGSADFASMSAAFSFDNIDNSPDIPVQKSNSAPTLPNSPSLSPRFLKQAAIYKRRSRHLSDRSSERSSIGSDEQISDEDLESLYSPTASPIKTRMFLKSKGFGRRPMVGSFEECLLQKRFVPKSQVGGFKLLLGASGSFCPSQMTIPAIASFYELPNESTLSTPYVCEMRLPRKGYTVPRVGTVQATILNPLGTVVRMFVVPYDFRDMPAMSQTFIRQRVLAVDVESEVNQNKDLKPAGQSTIASLTPGIVAGSTLSGLQHNVSFSEQMRTLRYAIHLRFQTSRSGRLALHTDIRLLISRRTDCDTAAAHAKGALESPNELRIVTIKPDCPKYSARQENPNKI